MVVEHTAANADSRIHRRTRSSPAATPCTSRSSSRIAPIEGRVHGAVTGEHPMTSRGQLADRLAETIGELRQRERSATPGGEAQASGIPSRARQISPTATASSAAQVAARHVDGQASQEHPGGPGRLDLFDRCGCWRHIEGIERPQPLAGHIERLTGGRDDVQVRRRGEEFGRHLGDGWEEVLTVVQHQQYGVLLEGRPEAARDVIVCVDLHAKGGGDGAGHQLDRLDRCQVDKVGADSMALAGQSRPGPRRDASCRPLRFR